MRRIAIMAAIAAAVLAAAYAGVQVYVARQAPAPTLKLDRDYMDFSAALDAARELRRGGESDAAIRSFLDTIEKYKDNPSVAHSILEPRFDLAELYRAAGRHADAEEQYGIIIARSTDPSTVARARIDLADMQAASGEDGIAALQAIYEEFKGNSEVAAKVCVKLASALGAKGRHREAADAASATLDAGGMAASAAGPLREQLDKALAELARHAGGPAEAGDVYAEQARTYPKLASLCWLWLEQAGVHYIRAGRYAAARNAFNTIARDYPGDGDSQVDVALGRIRELDEAEAAAATRLTAAGTKARIGAGEKLVVVTGELPKAAAWSPAGGICVVQGAAVVGDQSELVIEAGTRVEFTAHASLTVYGRVIARGTKEEPIVFASAAEEPSFFDWDGLRLAGGSGSVLEHVAISNAGTGLLAEEARFSLSNATVTLCGNAGMELRKATATADSCSVIENDGLGVVFESCAGSFEGGTISRNAKGGLVARKTAKPSISLVRFESNGGPGAQCFDGSDASFKECWFTGNRSGGLVCSYSGPAVDHCIFAGHAGAGIACTNNSAVNITGSGFGSNEIGVRCTLASSPSIATSHFSRNTAAGIRCESGSDPKITGNTFDRYESGYDLDTTVNTFEKAPGPGILVLDICRPTVSGNTFTADGIAIRLEGDYDLDATDNTWPGGTDARKLIEDKADGVGKAAISVP